MSKALKLLVIFTASTVCGSVQAATPISGITTFNGPESTAAFGPANGAGLFAGNVSGYDFRVVTSSAEAIGIYVGDLAWGTGNGVQYYQNSGNAVNLTRFTVSSNGGEDFNLKGFGVSLTTMNGTDTSVNVVVLGYLDGSQVGTFSRTLSLSSGSVQLLEPFDVSGTAGFNLIDEFRIEPGIGSQIGYLGIDNLHAVNFVPEPSSCSLLLGLGLLRGRRRN